MIVALLIASLAVVLRMIRQLKPPGQPSRSISWGRLAVTSRSVTEPLARE